MMHLVQEQDTLCLGPSDHGGGGTSGLSIQSNRWYNPQAGAWLSRDPVGFAGGQANLSGYVGNDPTNAVDPTGCDEVIRRKNIEKEWDEYLEMRFYFNWYDRDGILNIFQVGHLYPSDVPYSNTSFGARQNESVHDLQLSPNEIAGSEGAQPCVILVVNGPGKGVVNSYHFGAADSIPQTLQRDRALLVDGRAGIAGNIDNSKEGNFQLHVLLRTLKDLAIPVSGYYESHQLWVDCGGFWVKRQPAE